MASLDCFAVDPDELDDVVRALERTEASLRSTSEALEQEMRTLHDTWEGLAAHAHVEAHGQWTEGMQAMAEALADLRTAARVAHDNYTAAVQANLDMWDGLT